MGETNCEWQKQIRRDEGIILKDLDSKWDPGDRSGKWIKLKPDYINTGSDLDVLIIGGYFGSGRRGGEVAQFLLGLAESSKSGSYPTRFLSFCRVGSGLSDEECSVLVSKLKPYFRRNEKNSKVPSFYTVTNNAKERPDVWIDRPEKSIILEVTSDIRTINSEVFASPYSLRFPRIRRVRYDKPWYECLDVQSFMDLVQSRSGTIDKIISHGNLDQRKPKRTKHTSKGEKKMFTIVPAHMLRTDVSDVKQETLIFENLMFYFVSAPQDYSVENFHKMVVENGGSFSMNLNHSVTHTIAADKRGIKYQAAVKHGDVIHYSWLIDCCKQKSLLPLRSKYFLFLSDSSKEKMKEDIDEFGDHYFWDFDVSDMRQLFYNIDESKILANIVWTNHYIRKYCPSDKWCKFNNCCIYFHRVIHSINVDSQTVAQVTLRRLKMDVLMHGGVITGTLADATHMIVFSTTEYTVPFKTILESFTSAERNLLQRNRIHVLSHSWLEDSLEEQRRLPENTYSLRPNPDFYGVSLATEMESSTASIQEEDLVSENIQQRTATPERDPEPGNNAKQRLRNPQKRTRKKPVRQRRKALKLNDPSSESNASTDEGTPRRCLGLKNDTHMGGRNGKPPEESLKYHKKGIQTKEHSEEKESSDEHGRQTKDEEMVTDYHSIANGPEGSRENICDSVQAMLVDMIPGLDFKNAAPQDPPLVSASGPPKENDPVHSPGEGFTSQKKKRVSYRNVVDNLLDDM